MESGGSGIATTQSHHQGRASKHEHGDASHVQQHSAHAAGGGEVGARHIDEVVGQVLGLGQVDRRNTIVELVGCSNLDCRIGDSVVACRSLGFGEDILTSIKADDVELTLLVVLRTRGNFSHSGFSRRNGWTVCVLRSVPDKLHSITLVSIPSGIILVQGEACAGELVARTFSIGILGVVDLEGVDVHVVARGVASIAFAANVRVVGVIEGDAVLVGGGSTVPVGDFSIIVQVSSILDLDRKSVV